MRAGIALGNEAAVLGPSAFDVDARGRVYLLDPGVLDMLSANEVVDMPTLIERSIAEGKQSVVFPLREYWIDVGRLDDLQRASDEFQRIFG